jgi:hypothetical protein
MKLLHMITYTVPSSTDSRTLIESSTSLIRHRRLTTLGCERMLRRTNPLARIIKVEVMIDER